MPLNIRHSSPVGRQAIKVAFYRVASRLVSRCSARNMVRMRESPICVAGAGARIFELVEHASMYVAIATEACAAA